jgi:hypothetical protein
MTMANRVPDVSPFELLPDATGETVLVLDRRSHFTQAVPGHPGRAPAEDESPRYEARLVLADAPITVRYRLDSLPTGMQPGPLAHTLTLAYAVNRAAGMPRVTSARGERCEAWGVLGAASSEYGLAQRAADGDHESVTVLVRSTDDALLAMVVTYRFASAAVSPIQWTLFLSAASAGIDWRPAAPTDRAPNLWPESTFLRPGIRGELFPSRRAEVESLRARLVMAPGEREALRSRLTRLVSGSEAPASPIAPDTLEMCGTYLGETLGDGAARSAVGQVLAEIRVAQDLRGAALVLLAATEAAAS